MARQSRMQVWRECEALGLVPLFYHPDAETAKRIVDALRAGGARIIEFTNRGDRAVDVFHDLVTYCDEAAPDVMLGVGSVVDAVTAGIYMNQGASFVVGAIFDPDIARLCNRRKVAYFPGCATLSEISAAEEMGVEICKIFPGSVIGGPAFVRAVKGPSPWTRLMPTGGVDATRESLTAWFEAGVVCVGMGSKLIQEEFVESADWSALTELTAQCLAWIAEARRASA